MPEAPRDQGQSVAQRTDSVRAALLYLRAVHLLLDWCPFESVLARVPLTGLRVGRVDPDTND